MDKDDLWIVEHFSELVTKYAGKYVAVVNEKLVAVGNSGKEVEDKAREIEPHKMPSVLRVRREEDMAKDKKLSKIIQRIDSHFKT